jgi:ATP sulfurylase
MAIALPISLTSFILSHFSVIVLLLDHAGIGRYYGLFKGESSINQVSNVYLPSIHIGFVIYNATSRSNIQRNKCFW